MPTIPYKNKDGKRLSGVTTIIGGNLGWNKEVLNYWHWEQGRDGKDYRETLTRAADSGTIAHYMIECDLRKTKPDLEKYPADLIALAQQGFENYLEWKSMVRFRPVSMEPHYVSEKWQYGLTPDCIAYVNRKLSLFDWKTSSGVYPEMLIQLAAYKEGWDENNPKHPITGGAYLLRIDKQSASFHFHHWNDLTPGWMAFHHLLCLHGLQKTLKALV